MAYRNARPANRLLRLTVDEVALVGGPLTHSDGLAIDGMTLYAAVNAHNTIAVIDPKDATPATPLTGFQGSGRSVSQPARPSRRR